MARAACAWAIPGCQRGRGAGVGGAKGGSSATDRHGGVQHPERASTWRGCFSTCTTVASQHAPASHGSGAAPLSQCSVAAFRPRPGLRVRSRRSDAAMRRVSIWGGMRLFPGRRRPLLGLLRRPGIGGMSGREWHERQRACVAQARSAPRSVPKPGACFQAVAMQLELAPRPTCKN